MLEQPKPLTNPQHIFDGLVWDIVDRLSINKTTGKISHPWHWRVLPINPNWQAQTFPGDNNAHTLKNNVWIPILGYVSLDGLKRSFGSWQKVIVLEPNEKEVPEDFDGNWYYAVPDLKDPQNKVIRCSIQLNGPVRVLLGSDPFSFYGLDSNNHQILLKVSGPYSRKDSSIKHPLI